MRDEVGLFGRKSLVVQDRLSNKIERNTRVDLSGTAALVNQVVKTKVSKDKAEVH